MCEAYEIEFCAKPTKKDGTLLIPQNNKNNDPHPNKQLNTLLSNDYLLKYMQESKNICMRLWKWLIKAAIFFLWNKK